MPRWTLILLAVTAALLAVGPFGIVPGAALRGIDLGVSAAFLVSAVVAGQRNLALWCGVFAALFVLHQPLFAIDLGRYAAAAALGSAAAAAVCVIRHW